MFESCWISFFLDFVDWWNLVWFTRLITIFNKFKTHSPFLVDDKPHFAGLVAWNSICEASQEWPTSWKHQRKTPTKSLWKCSYSWMVPKIGGKNPKWMVKIMENRVFKWMIWGYHYFWKHPVLGNLSKSLLREMIFKPALLLSTFSCQLHQDTFGSSPSQ